MRGPFRKVLELPIKGRALSLICYVHLPPKKLLNKYNIDFTSATPPVHSKLYLYDRLLIQVQKPSFM